MPQPMDRRNDNGTFKAGLIRYDTLQSHKTYYQKHKEEIKLKTKKYRDTHKDWVKTYLQKYSARPEIKLRKKDLEYQKRYGLSIEAIEWMQEKQENKCLICGVILTTGKNCASKLTLDHDHKTGKIRGLICSRDNLMLGNAQDNPSLLLAGAEYLKKSE